MLTTTRLNDFTQLSAFSTEAGCEEIFLVVQSRPDIPFAEALREVGEHYSLAQGRAGLSDDTAVFSRLFMSDIAGQKQPLVRSAVFQRLSKGALSVIGQKPVSGGPLSLLSYHLRRPGKPYAVQRTCHAPDGWRNSALIKGENYSLLFTANFTGTGATGTASQTKEIFNSLDALIARHGMNMHGNAIRTWVFVRNIDADYTAMVNARREFFTAHGLTEKTRYLASTGIQGSSPSPRELVTVDSLSIEGLRPGQTIRMEAAAYLSPTILYGVTFERGIRVKFGDRSHLHISGTASIDAEGEVMHTGNAALQTRRTIENVRALLREQHADLRSMAYIIAYVRHLQDREQVREVLSGEIDETIPLIFAEAPVCRPEWLVELEGLAITQDTSEFPPYR